MRVPRVLPLFAFGLFVFGCSSGGSSSSGSSGGKPDLPPIISQNVHLVDQNSSNAAQVQGDRVVFPAAGNDALMSYKPGDIIVGRRGSKDGDNPYGFLRKVVSVEKKDGEIIVQTTFASLEDAVEQGAATLTDTVTMPSRFSEGATTAQQSLLPPPGLGPQDMGGAAGGMIDISGQVIPHLGAGVKATLTHAMFDFDPNIDVGIQFQHHKLKEFHAIFTGDLKTELALWLEGSVSSKPSWQSHQAQVYKIDKPLPLLWIGWLPVEVTMVVKVSVGVEAKVAHHFSVEAGGGLEGHVKAGGRYDADSGWDAVGDTSFSPYAIGPNLDYKADLEFKAQAPIVNIGFLIYDSAGPSIEIAPYGKFHTEFEPSCPWDLSVGCEGDFVGEAQVPVLGKSLGEVHLKIFDYEHKLEEGHLPTCEQPDAGTSQDAGGGQDAGLPPTDAGSDAGADDAGSTCAALAEKNGWKTPYCETKGNNACKGHGPATSDCDHCCEGTSCVDLGRQKNWQDLKCDQKGKPSVCGNFGTPTWDCDSCCGSTCTYDKDCKDGTVCASNGWGYCCQKPGAQGEPCFSSEECSGDQVCAWNGKNFVCTVPQCVDM